MPSEILVLSRESSSSRSPPSPPSLERAVHPPSNSLRESANSTQVEMSGRWGAAVHTSCRKR